MQAGFLAEALAHRNFYKWHQTQWAALPVRPLRLWVTLGGIWPLSGSARLHLAMKRDGGFVSLLASWQWDRSASGHGPQLYKQEAGGLTISFKLGHPGQEPQADWGHAFPGMAKQATLPSSHPQPGYLECREAGGCCLEAGQWRRSYSAPFLPSKSRTLLDSTLIPSLIRLLPGVGDGTKLTC